MFSLGNQGLTVKFERYHIIKRQIKITYFFHLMLPLQCTSAAKNPPLYYLVGRNY